MSEAPLRATRRGASSVLTLLFGKVFFRIHFALGLEGPPVPIERKSGLDPCLVGGTVKILSQIDRGGLGPALL